MSDTVLSKATASQRQAIHVNDALVRFHMSKVRPGRRNTRLQTAPSTGPLMVFWGAGPCVRSGGCGLQPAQARLAGSRLASLYPASEVPGLLAAAACSKGTKADRSAQTVAELQVQDGARHTTQPRRGTDR